MLFSMMLKQKSPEQREIVRGFVRHLLVGFGAGFSFGAVLYGLILMMMSGTSIEIPMLFALAMLMQAGALGGLVGMGIYMSRVAEREPDADTDGENDGGGTPEPVRPDPQKTVATPALTGGHGQPA